MLRIVEKHGKAVFSPEEVPMLAAAFDGRLARHRASQPLLVLIRGRARQILSIAKP